MADQQQQQHYPNRPPDPAAPPPAPPTQPAYPAPYLRLESRPGEGADGGVRIVAEGDLDLATAPSLREAMEASAGAAPPGRRAAVTVDLRAVEFIDSAGLAALMEARRAWQGRCELTLVVAPGSQPARVVRLSRLDSYLTVESAPPAGGPPAATSDVR